MNKYDTPDEAERQALESRLGHPPPFSQQECEMLTGELKIERARKLALVGHCVSLESLELLACEIRTLDFLKDLKQLKTLKVYCSTVEDMSAIAHCRQLEHVEIVFTFVQNLEPMVGLPALKSGVLLGNPWTPESYNILRPRLLSTPTEKWGKLPRIEFSREKDWVFTRQLMEQGVPVCFSVFDLNQCLVRPGIPKYPNSNCDFIERPLDWIEGDLEEPGATIDTLFDDELGERGPDSPRLDFDFEKHRTIGTSDYAQEWIIASALDQEAKDVLLRLVRRFPSVQYSQRDSTMWETLEQRNGITLPAWLRKILQVLTDFGPDLPRLARFDRFEHWSPYEEGIKAMWFQMAIGDPDDEQRIVMEKSALFPIAEEVNLTLAINLADPDDRRIYEYHREDISYSAGLTDSPQVVFDSYLNMLDHIAAIKVGGEIIEPQTGTT